MSEKARSATPFNGAVIALRRLESSEIFAFDFQPDAAMRGQIAADLGLSQVKKARLSGEIVPAGSSDWELNAQLGATVVQPCVITNQPVTTRIDVPVRRLYLRRHALDVTADEREFDGDDESEPMPAEIDLGQILTESLALAAPDYPRAEGAELGQVEFTAPGTKPLSDDDVKPFAALAALRDKMKE